jgi:integrase
VDFIVQIKLRYVQQRGNSLFFRLSIPVDLQDSFLGKIEISQTLNTSDPFEAYIESQKLVRAYKQKFQQLRLGNGYSNHRDYIISPEANSPLLSDIFRAEDPKKQDAPRLSELVDEINSGRNCKTKTDSTRKYTISQLIRWHGDLPASSFTRKMLIEFRDEGLLKLPPNFTQLKDFKNIPLKQLAKQNHPKTMTVRTVNNKFAYICALFNFAQKHGYISFNPAQDLLLSLSKAPSKERSAYKSNQLQRLIIALSDQTKGDREIRHQRYWVTMICLYSGARINEIAQLGITDIKVIDDIPCFNLTTEGERVKSLKNSRSERIIPIHPELIKLGLMNFHKKRLSEVRNPETASLWYEASHCVDGNWGRKVSRWFNNRLRPAFLTAKELADHQSRRKSYCFHSLRHTWIAQAQNQAQMHPRIEMRLTGHADAFISEEHARYGKDMHPSIMLKELVKLDYGLDLSAVMGRY